MELVPMQLHLVKVFALPLGHESMGLPTRKPPSAPVQILSHQRRATQPLNWGKAKGKGKKSQEPAGMKENRPEAPHASLCPLR